MLEILFYVLFGMFILSAIGWVISLFYMKKSMVPMWIMLIVVQVLNIGIQVVNIAIKSQ